MPADTDSSVDLYMRSGGTTTLITTGPSGGNGPYDVQDVGIPATGDNVFFDTNESLVPADTDGKRDVYLRSGNTTTLVSTGPAGGNGNFDAVMDAVGGSGHFGPYGRFGVTDGGGTVFFQTSESLVPADVNNASDTYEWSNGAISLATPQSPHGALVTRFSTDGANVVFSTLDPLVPEDTNGEIDIYARFGSTTKLVGPAGTAAFGVCGEDTECPFLLTMSDDASHIFFYSPYPLVPGASNGGVFEYSGGRLYLMPGDPSPFGRPATSGDGKRLLFITGRSLLSGPKGGPGLYTVTEGPGYPRPRGATPMQVFLVPAYAQCTASNRTHGSPLSYGSCAPPSALSTYLTVGTPESNGQGAKSIAKIVYTALPGNSATPADEADVDVAVSISDVRKKSDLSDYAGQLSLESGLRITDRDNTSGDAATVQDTTLRIPIACTATADTTVGSNCNLHTTADALAPGTVKEGVRATWQLAR